MIKTEYSYFITTLVFLLFTALPPAMAKEVTGATQTIDCTYEDNYPQNLVTHLTDLQKEAVKIGQEICLSSLLVLPNESINVTGSLVNFAVFAKKEFDNLFPDTVFSNMSQLSQSWYRQVTDSNNDYRNYSLIKASRIIDDSRGFSKTEGWDFELYSDIKNTRKNYAYSDTLKNYCAEVVNKSPASQSGTSKDCEDVLRPWTKAVSPFQYLYSNRIMKDNGKKIAFLQNQWNTFIDESRYQTPLDVWATTTWHRNQFKRHHLSGPPPTQLFLLHPTIVYEHLPDANKGSKEDVSLAIEWAGINWWKPGFGFSVTSVYKDRKDQPSVGTGVTFHIKNKYSLGYVYRDGGDDGIFFNIDIMEWFGSKDQKYKKYKTYFE